MDFQSHQEEAKQSTTKLIALLVLGVLSIIAVVTALLVALLYYGSDEFQPVTALAVAAPVTTIAVVGTSLVKSSQIKSGGGSYVAASMGGRQVDFNTLDPAEKQLANIVEEIAIASGMPVPAVFVLDDEPGINAFAAGWSADSAAIGVTRGALLQLNRRELQGVIAHEFSHIGNGDTRVKTRIIGWVFGIAAITVVGRILLQQLWWAPRRRSKEDRTALLIVAAGVGLLVIGAVGTLFARMIQAAVSRQREYLADASAVQYTRDPSGIGDALIKIGGMGRDNKVRAAHATEANHLFFASALGASFATHPSLKDRIARLLPDWDGQFKRPAPAAPGETPSAGAGTSSGAGQRGGWWPGQVVLPTGAQAGSPIDTSSLVGGGSAEPLAQGGPTAPSPTFEPPSFGGPTDAHVERTRTLLTQIPQQTQDFLRTKQGAVAAVVGAFASNDPQLRPQQLEVAGRAVSMEPDYLDAAGTVITDLDRTLQLPAIDIALHAIRQTPYEYKVALGQAIHDLESSQSDHDLFRWVLRRVMLRHLEDQHDDGSVSYDTSLGELKVEAVAVYAILAQFNSSGTSQAQDAFDAALSAIGLPPEPVPPIEQLTFDRIDRALDRLSRMDRASRETFVSGAAAAVLHDRKTTAEEAELIRVVADAVRLPVPPLLPVVVPDRADPAAAPTVKS
ncbi:MAG: M48 family metallopeptidase [Acidimicrobiia bacterium]|nr:M48 family metallopeptidase [Acidimicrobiia bacterium]